MKPYETLRDYVNGRLEEGKKDGQLFRYLGDLPELLKELPTETLRKKLVRDTILTEYWGKEKAESFEDGDVYTALMLVKVGYERRVPEKERGNEGLVAKVRKLLQRT